MSNSDIKKLIEDEYRIDVDSIRNLSKLANDLTINNKLIIPGGLEIQGPLKVTKDITTDGNGYFGPAFIGNHNKNDSRFAQFCHKNMTSVSQYAFLQGADGKTFINTPNKTIYFRNNNSDKFTMDNNGNMNFKGQLRVNKDIITDGNGYFGPAYVGKYGGTDSDYAHFSHKDMRKTSQYALLQYKGGHTYLNTANKAIYFRNNNSTKMEMKTDGNFYINGNYAFKHGDNTLLYNASHNAYIENCGLHKANCSGGYGVRSHTSKSRVSGGSGKFTLLKI